MGSASLREFEQPPAVPARQVPPAVPPGEERPAAPAIDPASPELFVAGVSKLPNGTPGLAAATFTWMNRGELDAPGAVTVMVALGPAVAVI